MSKNSKSKIWLYAVVLFTSAFIVLLITGYSQIKLNKNLSELSNQISTKENEKNKVQLSFANAQELNNKLTEENKQLQNMIEGLNNEIEMLKSDRDTADNTNSAKLDAYEKLSLAENEYLKGNIVVSAGIMKDIDPNQLNTNAGVTITLLKGIVYNEAGKLLLTEGHEQYVKKNYNTAVEKLAQSLLYAPDKEYSDKCIYYLALSEAKAGNAAAGAAHMSSLVEQYPKSHYLSSAKRFITKYADMKP